MTILKVTAYSEKEVPLCQYYGFNSDRVLVTTNYSSRVMNAQVPIENKLKKLNT